MRGFTLIELLVVMAILSLVAFVVITNAPEPRSDLRREADKFALGLRLADEAATLSGRPVRLRIVDDSYFFEKYNGGRWDGNVSSKFPSSVKLSRNIQMSVQEQNLILQNERVPDQNQLNDPEIDQKIILMDPAGLPPTIETEFKQRNRVWIVRRDADGIISVARGRR